MILWETQAGEALCGWRPHGEMTNGVFPAGFQS
jgi:hypothetical protein